MVLIMNHKSLIHVFLCFILFLGCSLFQVFGDNNYSSKNCVYPAIYNFGDSNSDTGAGYAAFYAANPPNGMNLFKNIPGRFSDGRVIVDFISEELNLPYLSSYLNSIGSNYSHGANFAVGGASIRPGQGYTPFHLSLQVSQFVLFKSRIKSGLHEDFSNAIYTIDIGQNDLAYGFQQTSEKQVQRSIPEILTKLSQAVKKLYAQGARVFWIHNTGPIGCLPFNYIQYERKKGNLDANGCVKPLNKIAQEFNKLLKDQVFELRSKLPLGKFTYVDIFKAKYEIINNATSQGFVSVREFCCGSHPGSYHITCGDKEIINGVLNENLCKNSSKHIIWDGIHYSERANKLVSEKIMDGSFSDPPVPIGKACFF